MRPRPPPYRSTPCLPKARNSTPTTHGPGHEISILRRQTSIQCLTNEYAKFTATSSFINYKFFHHINPLFRPRVATICLNTQIFLLYKNLHAYILNTLTNFDYNTQYKIEGTLFRSKGWHHQQISTQRPNTDTPVLVNPNRHYTAL